jgi:hemerythrin
MENYVKEHNKFVEHLKKFRGEHRGFSKEGTGQLLFAINDWVKDHILEKDK